MPRFRDVTKYLLCEIYAVPNDVLSRCDQLEGHPNCYRREPVAMVKDHVIEAYSYPHVIEMSIPQKDIAAVLDDAVILSFA